MVIETWAVSSFCGPAMSMVCFWWTRRDVGYILPLGRLSCVEKLSDVNIWRYGKGSASSTGRCDGTGFSSCFGRGGGTERAANGRNEQSRLDTGAGFSGSVLVPLMSDTNFLVLCQSQFGYHGSVLDSLQTVALWRPQRILRPAALLLDDFFDAS